VHKSSAITRLPALYLIIFVCTALQSRQFSVTDPTYSYQTKNHPLFFQLLSTGCLCRLSKGKPSTKPVYLQLLGRCSFQLRMSIVRSYNSHVYTHMHAKTNIHRLQKQHICFTQTCTHVHVHAHKHTIIYKHMHTAPMNAYTHTCKHVCTQKPTRVYIQIHTGYKLLSPHPEPRYLFALHDGQYKLACAMAEVQVCSLSLSFLFPLLGSRLRQQRRVLYWPSRMQSILTGSSCVVRYVTGIRNASASACLEQVKRK